MLTTALLLLFALPRASTATCFRPDGVVGDADIQPCHADLPTGSNSACCNLGKSPSDLCLSGGLCYRQDGYDGNALIYAVGCTDVTGADKACQQYCPTGETTAFLWALNACFDGRWCCNNLTTSESCCDPHTGEGTFTMDHLLSLDPTPSATGAAVQTLTVTSVVTTTGSAAENGGALGGACPNGTGTCPKNNGPGAIVGSSIGSAAGGFALAALLSFFLFRRASHRRTLHLDQAGGMTTAHTQQPYPDRQQGWRHEMDSKGRMSLALPTEDSVRRGIGTLTGPNHQYGQETTGFAHEIDSTGRVELR